MPRKNRTPHRKRTTTIQNDPRPLTLAAMAEDLVERGLCSSAVLGPRPAYNTQHKENS